MAGSALRSLRYSSLPTLAVVLAALGWSLLPARPALARSAGIDSSQFSPAGGCNDCHSGGVAPQVALSSSASSILPGEQITLTFVVTSQGAAQIAAGFNVRSSQRGTFAVGGPDAASTRTIANATTGWLEATHSAAKTAVNTVTTFSTLWTPDAGVSGEVTLTAWGNSVNRATGRNGDRASTASITVTVCTPATFYRDADGDGHGNPADALTACSAPTGYVPDATDCNDADPAVHPGAPEVCNGQDDDCDSAADEDLGSLTCGEPPCQTTVPACLDGVPQLCTPLCPPPPDAAPEPDAEPPPEPDAAPADPDAGAPADPDAAAPPDDPTPPDGDIQIPFPTDPMGCACTLGAAPTAVSLPLAVSALLLLTVLRRRRPR